jgi:hypothetical protein
VTYLCDETQIAPTQEIYFDLAWGLGIEDNLDKMTHDFLEQTARCRVPG